MIYFIKHTDYLKIGYTYNQIKTRLSQLQVSCPVKLEVLGLIEGTLDDELKYHAMFDHLGSSGKWFKLTKELQEYIERLNKDLMWKYGFLNNISSVIGLIKECRLEKNWSMEELGEAMGVTKQAVMDMEHRDMKGCITVGALHKALNSMGKKYQHRAI